MTERPLTHSCYGMLALALALSLLAAIRPGHADVSAPLSARLDIIWSTPITTEMTPTNTFGRSRGLVFGAGAVTPDGAVVFLARLLDGRSSGLVLIVDAEKAGPDAVVPIELPVPDPPGSRSFVARLLERRRPNRDPVILGFAIGAGGEMWLSGFANSSMGIASDAHRDAYLAKLDGTGRPTWERSYGNGDWLAIESVAPAATGGLVGVGRGMGTSWLAKVAADGTLLMERRFGNGKGAAVVPLRDGRFLVAGFTGEGRAATYQDDVSTWVLDEAGGLRGPTRVREAMNRTSAFYSGYVVASAVADGAYVASNWRDMFRPQAVEVTRVGPEGTPLWRRRLPDTITPRETAVTTFDTCDPVLATLADGDALVACALNGQIQLYRLDRETGQQRSTLVPLPECQRGHFAALFLMVRRDGMVLLGGSKPGGNVAESCSWLGRLTMQAG